MAAASMLDLLSSPLRGYIAQSLQFYLGKYIEGIQLEGLGLFGGDLVLNDLEIKRHVLLESLEIPSAFDLARGFIRELRIHIPWTALLSQPIEVKLYTIELILVSRSDAERAARRASLGEQPPPLPGEQGEEADEAAPQRIDQPKSGWLHDTLQKILANISVQVNNLVLKYEQEDIVLSVALGTLDFYSANPRNAWTKGFENPGAVDQAIGKRIDVKDLTIFLDRYTSSGPPTDDPYLDRLRRKVVGYEVPVLTRTSVSVRGKFLLRPTVLPDEKSSEKVEQSATLSASVFSKVFNIDGMFAYEPSTSRDPFYTYSCARSSVITMHEVDVFVGELLFSMSDRQLTMIIQLIEIATRSTNNSESTLISSPVKPKTRATLDRNIPPNRPPREQTRQRQSYQQSPLPSPTPTARGPSENPGDKPTSWLGWAMNALGAVEEDEEDELMAELLSESKRSLEHRRQSIQEESNKFLEDAEHSQPTCVVSTVRVCISSASLTLRKHENISDKQGADHQEESEDIEDQFVPVANLGLVKVSTPGKRNQVSRPPTPILSLTLTYVALEALIARASEKDGIDVAFEVENVEVVSISGGSDARSSKGETLLQWGSVDTSSHGDYVSHPYFTASFFSDEARRLSKRHSRSFELVKVSFDTEIPVWKTIEVRDTQAHTDKHRFDSPCSCSVNWNGENRPCTPKSELAMISQRVTTSIGIKERILDEGILTNAVIAAWAASGVVFTVTPTMARNFIATTREYKLMRSPDDSPSTNLRRYLEPGLLVIFARHTLHSCQASVSARLEVSANETTAAQQRSVHSAMRLRFARLAEYCENSGDQVTEKTDRRETMSSTIVDISLGEAVAKLELEKCTEVATLIMDVAQKSQLGQQKSDTSVAETFPIQVVDKSSQGQSVATSSSKLLTFSKLSVTLSAPKDTQANSYDVTGTALGLVWQDQVEDEQTTSVYQVGNLSLVVDGGEVGSSENCAWDMLRAVGLDVTITSSSASSHLTDSRFEIAIGLDKLNGQFNDWILTTAIAAVDACSASMFSLKLLGPHKLPNYSANLFQVEVSRAFASRNVVITPRLKMSDRVDLRLDVGSASLYRRKGRSDPDMIFQSGSLSITKSANRLSQDFLSIGVRVHKTPGVVVSGPLSVVFNSGLIKTDDAARLCKNLVVDVRAAAAYIEGNLKGINQLVSHIYRVVSRLSTISTFPHQNHRVGVADQRDPTKKDIVVNTSTPWEIYLDVKIQGLRIHLNQFLALLVPTVNLETPKLFQGNPQNADLGYMHIVCVVETIEICATQESVVDDSQRVFAVGPMRAVINYWHKNVERRELHALDITVSISTVESFLTQLKVTYLLKIPLLSQTARKDQSIDQEQRDQPVKPQPEEALRTTNHATWWSCKVGLQLECVRLVITSDICRVPMRGRTHEVVKSSVTVGFQSVSLALRLANHHPTNRHLGSTEQHFTDIQCGISAMEVTERILPAKLSCLGSRFGEFGALSEHIFLGILLCLDLDALLHVSSALKISAADSPQLPSAMRCWHLSSQLAKSLQNIGLASEVKVKCQEPAVPLLCVENDKSIETAGQDFPVLSFFSRNYGDQGQPAIILALTVGDVDLSITTSSLYCFTGVLSGVQNTANNASQPSISVARVPTSQRTSSKLDAQDIRVSIQLGQIRIILPSEHLTSDLLLQKVSSTAHVCVVVEGTFIASTSKFDILLDGLGYPPFNSRLLPRRAHISTSRFGKTQDRIEGRVGKIYAVIANLVQKTNASSESSSLRRGGFANKLSREVGKYLEFESVETILCPFSSSCVIEATTCAVNLALSVTKIRVDLQQASFAILNERTIGLLRALSSVVIALKSTPDETNGAWDEKLSSQTPITSVYASSEQSSSIGVLQLRLDGIEVNLFTTTASMHLRVANIVIESNTIETNGAASIQNIAVGYRKRSTKDERLTTEEVVFGAYADPTLWQLAVDNYHEKLISGRWNFPDSHEGSIFVDVQGFQLHLSAHFAFELLEFSRRQTNLVFSHDDMRNNIKVKKPSQTSHREISHIRTPRQSLKVLIAPSVVSLWEYNARGTGGAVTSSSAWVSCGEVFVSVMLGADEAAERPLQSEGTAVHVLNRFVLVKSGEFVMSAEKLGTRVSSSMDILHVEFINKNGGSVPGHASSNWKMFVSHLTSTSEMRRVLEESSVRITGEHFSLIERHATRKGRVVLLTTPLTQTSVQVELSPVRVKLSSYALEASSFLLQSITQKRAKLSMATQESETQPQNDKRALASSSAIVSGDSELSTDDFGHLRRIDEARHPLPGELAFTNTLFIENASLSECFGTSKSSRGRTRLFVDCSQYADDVELSEVSSFIDEANMAWGVDNREFNGNRPQVPDLESSQTLSWMSMRWCYHMPRAVKQIIADPVPIPPSGVPIGWPLWSDESSNEETRLCDIMCQLRCWDYSVDRYVVVSEFFTPWDTGRSQRRGNSDSDEPDTFSELVSQWFDDDLENRRFLASMLDLAGQSRTYTIDGASVSDKWELRWRHPLGDAKGSQKRFLLNALLASSLKLSSTQDASAFQQVVVTVAAPSIALAICYVSTSRDSHDIITAELLDSSLVCLAYPLATSIRVASSFQVYLENMAQLLSVSVIPRVAIGSSVELSESGAAVSALVGPASIYLTQTSILVLASIPTILQRRPSKQQEHASAAGKLGDMRIVVVNQTGVDLWCRQTGTTERILVGRNQSIPYSWQSLGGDPFYRLEFALEDPSTHVPSAQPDTSKKTYQLWCDPCVIKQNGATGRLFPGHGYVWVCVELRGLQTRVTLRADMIFRNMCDFPVSISADQEVLWSKRCDAATFQPTETLTESNSEFFMTEAAEQLQIALSADDSAWSRVQIPKELPSPFDLVKQRDEEKASQRSSQAKSKSIQPQLIPINSSPHPVFGWVKMERVKASMLSPTQVDSTSLQLTRRYGWVEATLWPAIAITNTTNVAVVFTFLQKGQCFKYNIAPTAPQWVSNIDPLQASEICVASTEGEKNIIFGLEGENDWAGAVHRLGEMQIVMTRPSNAGSHADAPSFRIQVERYLTVLNMTPSVVQVKIKTPANKAAAEICERVDTCATVSFGCDPSESLWLAIGGIREASLPEEPIERWSPGRTLRVTGDSKVFIVPDNASSTKTMVSTYAVTLANIGGRVQITIRPQIVISNTTDFSLRIIPTDGAGSKTALMHEAGVAPNDTWSLPLCLHKDPKRRSLTNDVSNWLNSKFSRRPSDDVLAPPAQPQLARLSCSFRVSIDAGDPKVNDFEVSEEIGVRLPALPLLVSSDGKIMIVEAPRSAQVATSEAGDTSVSAYPKASSTTLRRRLLIRHRAFRHKMLTYTITQSESSILIAFFIDHQAPVAVLNQWSQPLGFRNLSDASRPEAVSPGYYLEYDWSLQARGNEPLGHQLEQSDGVTPVQTWLDETASLPQLVDPDFADDKRVRFQIGTHEFGWSNALWQVGGIQFATLVRGNENEESVKITFLVMCHYRAGSWIISATCLEDDSAAGYQKDVPALMLPPTASLDKASQKGPPKFLHLSFKIDKLELHLSDEYDPFLDERGMIMYPEVFRVTCRSIVIAFLTSPESPEALRHIAKLGYLSHVRAYTTLFVGIGDGEIDHFLEECNFPVMLCFPEQIGGINTPKMTQSDVWQELQGLNEFSSRLLDKHLPDIDRNCVVVRVTYADTWDPLAIPAYFHSIELKLAPAVLQLEDDIISHVSALLQPITDALNGSTSPPVSARNMIVVENNWSDPFQESIAAVMQRRVFVEELVLSDIQVTVTARVTIPVLNSFDGTPLRFGASRMRNVFQFPDQLLKDIAADYVADAIVRSPMLLMSLNIIGNPAGFFRNFSTGVRNLVEIPLAATRDGYNPWVLTKGVVGGVASFFGHAAAATLVSVSGFSYSVSRTMDQLTMPRGQLQKRRYRRPTRLTSGIADGLGALGSSVVGAATGVITTPIAVYKERQLQGLDPGVGNVVSGLGMGLVGVVARPVGGMASLISLTSDGLLYGSGMGETRLPFGNTGVVPFDARPNELLRYKLKVLPDTTGTIVFAHGVWVDPVIRMLAVPSGGLSYLDLPGEGDRLELRQLLRSEDEKLPLLPVILVCSSTHIFLIGRSGEQPQVVLAQCALLAVQTIEESLREPTMLDLGVRVESAGIEWLRLRLAPSERRAVGNQLRLWLSDAK